MVNAASRQRAPCDDLLSRVCDDASHTSYANAVDGLMALRGPGAAVEQLLHLRTRMAAAGVAGEEDNRDLQLLDRAVGNFHAGTN